MDPTDFFSFSHYLVKLSTEKTYHYVDQKPEKDVDTGVTLLLVHGFPDLW